MDRADPDVRACSLFWAVGNRGLTPLFSIGNQAAPLTGSDAIDQRLLQADLLKLVREDDIPLLCHLPLLPGRLRPSHQIAGGWQFVDGCRHLLASDRLVMLDLPQCLAGHHILRPLFAFQSHEGQMQSLQLCDVGIEVVVAAGDDQGLIVGVDRTDACPRMPAMDHLAVVIGWLDLSVPVAVFHVS